MPSPAQLTNQALTFNLYVERETRSAHALLFYEANHQAGGERRAVAMGSESHGDDSLFSAGLESTLVLRKLHSVLPHQDSWQRLLVPSGKLGVEFSYTADSLTEQLALMPALPD